MWRASVRAQPICSFPIEMRPSFRQMRHATRENRGALLRQSRAKRGASPSAGLPGEALRSFVERLTQRRKRAANALRHCGLADTQPRGDVALTQALESIEVEHFAAAG